LIQRGHPPQDQILLHRIDPLAPLDRIRSASFIASIPARPRSSRRRRGRCPPPPGVVHRSLGALASAVGRGGIAELRAQERQHRLSYFRGDRRGGVVIQIDRIAHASACSRSAIRSAGSSRPMDRRSIESAMPRRVRSSGVRP